MKDFDKIIDEIYQNQNIKNKMVWQWNPTTKKWNPTMRRTGSSVLIDLRWKQDEPEVKVNPRTGKPIKQKSYSYG